VEAHVDQGEGDMGGEAAAQDSVDIDMDLADEYLPDGQGLGGEVVYEDTDYRLDCSVCRRRGMNLDANQKLVGCDMCDRWEHVVCHRKAAEKAGLPKPDFEKEDFICEDCQMIDESVIVPAAPKRARSDKQLAGARKGAEKRKAKFEARRKEKERTKKVSGAASIADVGSPVTAGSAQSPPSSSTKAGAKQNGEPKSRKASTNKKGKKVSPASPSANRSVAEHAPQGLVQQQGQLAPEIGGSNFVPYFDHRAQQQPLPPAPMASMLSFNGLASHAALPASLAQSASPLQNMSDILPPAPVAMHNYVPQYGMEDKHMATMPQAPVSDTQNVQQQTMPDIDPALAGEGALQ
jgi:hypothetical protein